MDVICNNYILLTVSFSPFAFYSSAVYMLHSHFPGNYINSVLIQAINCYLMYMLVVVDGQVNDATYNNIWKQVVGTFRVFSHESRFEIAMKNCKNFAILYTPYISRGFYFHEFRASRVLFANSQHTKISLPPIPTQQCDLSVRNTRIVQYTVHVQMSDWYWFLRPPSMIALLLDREFNHSRKCVEGLIRE